MARLPGGRGRSREPRTINRDRMTRIGFAYNQKPQPAAGGGRWARRRCAQATRSRPVAAAPTTYAEWDYDRNDRRRRRALACSATSLFEASDEFPERLVPKRPDIVFKSPRLTGVNRESHVPAICESSTSRTQAATPSRSDLLDKGGRRRSRLQRCSDRQFAVVESIRDVELLLDGRQEEICIGRASAGLQTRFRCS